MHLLRLPEKGTSNAPILDLLGLRNTKWAQTCRFGIPQGNIAGTSETFRTVSLGNRVKKGNKRKGRSFVGIPAP
jgi:hypothetical protein